MLPAHVQVAMDAFPKRVRINKNTDSRRKNLTQQFETVWEMEGEVSQPLHQTKKVWELFKERNSLDFTLYELALKYNCSAQ